jgi:hypothetical protein
MDDEKTFKKLRIRIKVVKADMYKPVKIICKYLKETNVFIYCFMESLSIL